MCAVAVAGWQLQRQARAVAAGPRPSLAATKPVIARYFAEHVVPEALGLAARGDAAAPSLLYALVRRSARGMSDPLARIADGARTAGAADRRRDRLG